MAGAPLFNMFGRPRPYDPMQQPEVPASFPQEAAPMATPQAAPQRQSMFGMFGRGLRQVGGQAKDAILGGEHGRDPNIFDFVLGGFGPSGAMGHVGEIRQGAQQDRGRKAIVDALGASRGMTDPNERINSMFDLLPPETQMELLIARMNSETENRQKLALDEAGRDDWVDLTPEQMAERGYRGGTSGQMNTKTGEISVRQQPLRPTENGGRQSYPDDGYEYFE